MIPFNPDMNFASEFTTRWNQKLKSIRTASFIVSILMILFGILCAIFPMQTVNVLEILACVLLMAFGIYQIINYNSEPVWFRYPGSLISGILNILISIMLLASPSGVAISTFAFMFGWILMMAGIEKISYSSKLRFFQVTDCGWVTASGVFDIIASLLFIFLPLASTLALNFILAAYLIVGGITLLVEAFQMKDMKVTPPDDII